MNVGIVRYSVRLSLPIVLLTLMLPCDRLWAQTDPFVGSWRFVPERSRFAGTGPKDIKLRFAVETGKLREESEVIAQNGKSLVAVNIHRYDGEEHPFELVGETRHSKHTIRWKRIDDHTIEIRVNHDDGKEYTTERQVISPDGKELTLTHSGQRPDGTPYESVYTFVRQ